MQTSVKSLPAFVHSDAKNALFQSRRYILRTLTWRPWHVRIRRVNGNTRSCVVAIMFAPRFALRVALGGSHNPSMNTLWRTMRYSSHQRTVSVAYHSVPTPTTSWLPPAIGCWEVQDNGNTIARAKQQHSGPGCECWGRGGERGRKRLVLMTIRHVCGRVHVPAMNIHVHAYMFLYTTIRDGHASRDLSLYRVRATILQV